MPLTLLAALCLATAGHEPAPSTDDSETVRILVATPQQSLSISGDHLLLARVEEAGPLTARADISAGDSDELNEAIRHPGVVSALPSGTSRFTCRDGAARVNGEPERASILRVSSASGTQVLGRSLRGGVELRCGTAGWTVINELPVEEYLAAVLGGEMSPSFPLEALKAQAIAARTYALQKKLEARAQGRACHLGATALSQVYKGLESEDPRTREAVLATRGQILSQGMVPVEAYFHASCGGRTEAGLSALGRDLPYLKSVSCPCGGHSPLAHWKLALSRDELSEALRRIAPGLHLKGIKVSQRTSSGRVRTVVLETDHAPISLTAVEFRKAVGYTRLPSLWFDVDADGSQITFAGRGAGHGAGLCQWGARIQAEHGSDYRQILSYYYPGTEIRQLY
jgi:stage II sporulation protein D